MKSKGRECYHGIHFVVAHCKCFAALGQEVHLNEDCGNIVAHFLPRLMEHPLLFWCRPSI